jgi:hypothetical protein
LSLSFLSLLVFLFALAGIIISFINALRKSKKPNLKLGWILVPLILSFLSLIVNRYVNSGISDTNHKTIDTLNQRLSNMENLKNDLTESQNEVKTIHDSLNIILKKRKEEDSVFKIKSEELRRKSEENSNRLGVLDTRTKQRKISTESAKDLLNILSKHKNEKIQISCLMNDQEALALASQLSSIFEQAGWSIVMQQFQNISPINGIVVNIQDIKFEQKASFIFKILQDAKLNPKAGGIDKINVKNEVEILVGTNPEKTN